MWPGDAARAHSRSTISCGDAADDPLASPEWNVIHGPTIAAVAVPPRKP